MAEYYKANPKYRDMARTMIEFAPHLFGHIDIDALLFYNKEEKNPKKVMDIKSIKEPLLSEFGKEYYIEISEDLAGSLSQEHLEIHIYRILRQIGGDPAELVKPNVTEFSDILVHFGYDWQSQNNLPSIYDILEVPQKDEEVAASPF